MTTGLYETASARIPGGAHAAGFGGWLAVLWAFACVMMSWHFAVVISDGHSLGLMFGSPENIAIMRVVLWLKIWLWAPFLILAPLGHRLMPSVAILAVLAIVLGEGYVVISLLDLDSAKTIGINVVNGLIGVVFCSYLIFSKRVASIRVSTDPVDVRARHHFSMLVLVAGSVSLAVFGAAPETIADRVSILTAYQFMILLAFVLTIGPLRTLRTGRTTINIYLRRDAGIWAGIAALLHLVAGIEESMNASYVSTFIDVGPSGSPDILRQQLFAWGTVVGLIIAVLVMLLLALSNDRAIHRYGKRWWKRVHRASYGVFVMAAMHALIFQFLEGRNAYFVAFAVLWVTVIAAMQFAGFIAVRRKRRLRLLRRLQGR